MLHVIIQAPHLGLHNLSRFTPELDKLTYQICFRISTKTTQYEEQNSIYKT